MKKQEGVYIKEYSKYKRKQGGAGGPGNNEGEARPVRRGVCGVRGGRGGPWPWGPQRANDNGAKKRKRPGRSACPL